MYLYVCVIVLSCLSASQSASIDRELNEIADNDRDEKFLKLWSLVEFSNGYCNASSGLTGTCFTALECEANSGTADGTCAAGFGVCCVFKRNCGEESCFNNTYFESPSYDDGYEDSGTCMVELQNVYESDTKSQAEEVKCLKLEFEDVDILGPVNGDCTNDTITISGAADGITIPTICGMNSGQHMYVDVTGSDGPYKITVTTSTEDYARKWRIRVVQYTDSAYCPPKNCLQYFDDAAGSIMSFNYVEGGTNQLINDLDYAVCFKTNDGFCDLALTSDSFDIGKSPACDDDYIATIGACRTCGTTFADMQLNSTSLLFFQVKTDSDNTNGDAGFNIDYMGLTC